MLQPPISIVTPCFNHGHYLDEAFDSIQLQEHYASFEHIIVNDGSTDLYTLKKLDELETKGCKVIHQQNLGLAAARNIGVEHAAGTFILPLDADNKIKPGVFIKALQLMQAHPDIDVVYTNKQCFGDDHQFVTTGGFNVHRLITWNYIDACALISKKVLLDVGKYDTKMPAMGHEDWDLWISIASKGGVFYYLDETGFEYRVTGASMSQTHTGPGLDKNRAYLFQKHAGFIAASYQQLISEERAKEKELDSIKNNLAHQPIKSCLKIITGRKFF